MKKVKVGTTHTEILMPKPSDLASAVGNTGVHVVSSPSTILYIEMACHRAIDGFFEADDATVGVGFNFKHVGAAMPGQEVNVTVELKETDGKKLRFAATVMQGDRLIMEGEHVRALISLSRLLGTQEDSEAAQWTFWFDVHSPWAYLAAHRVGDLAREQGVKLVWRPLHLPSLIEQINGRQPLTENQSFTEWYAQDLQDHAAIAGLDVKYHADFPLRNSRALRTCLYAAEQGCEEEFVKHLMRAYWTDSHDISDLEVLAGIADRVGLDSSKTINSAIDRRYKKQLQDNTGEAIERGVFGVPTIDTGGRLYFGFDRLPLLERHCNEKNYASIAAG